MTYCRKILHESSAFCTICKGKLKMFSNTNKHNAIYGMRASQQVSGVSNTSQLPPDGLVFPLLVYCHKVTIHEALALRYNQCNTRFVGFQHTLWACWASS